MAKRVVDVLEMVEVEVMHGELVGAAPGPREFQIEPFEKGCAVGKTGQRVGPRQRCYILHRELAVGDIGENAFDGDELVLLVAHRISASFEPGTGTIRLLQAEFD